MRSRTKVIMRKGHGYVLQRRAREGAGRADPTEKGSEVETRKTIKEKC